MTQMDASAWLLAFVTATRGRALTQAETDTILELASVAAHSSERMAAPLTCWVAAAAGMSPTEALAIARSLVTEP